MLACFMLSCFMLSDLGSIHGSCAWLSVTFLWPSSDISCVIHDSVFCAVVLWLFSILGKQLSSTLTTHQLSFRLFSPLLCRCALLRCSPPFVVAFPPTGRRSLLPVFFLSLLSADEALRPFRFVSFLHRQQQSATSSKASTTQRQQQQHEARLVFVIEGG